MDDHVLCYLFLTALLFNLVVNVLILKLKVIQINPKSSNEILNLFLVETSSSNMAHDVSRQVHDVINVIFCITCRYRLKLTCQDMLWKMNLKCYAASCDIL
jgi:hypothetical protein